VSGSIWVNAKNKTAHHPGVEADVSVCLVLVPLSRVDLDHVKLPVLPVPVENPLYARPPTPLHAPPARLSAAHPHLRHPRNIDIRAIDPRVAPARTPRLIRLARRWRRCTRMRTARAALGHPCSLLLASSSTAPVPPGIPTPTPATTTCLRRRLALSRSRRRRGRPMKGYAGAPRVQRRAPRL
jgi:hypothetical protein